MTAPAVLAQARRFAAIDPLLPLGVAEPDGERLEATTADGRTVTAILQRHSHAPGSMELLWSAAEVWQLFPFAGDTGTEGVDALLRAWRTRMDSEHPPADSACTVTWPSRDAEAIRAFLDHGLIPLAILAVRTGRPAPTRSQGEFTVRRARPADFDDVLALAIAEFDYSALVGSTARSNTAELVAPQLRRKLEVGEEIWLAEKSGSAIGLAECGWIDSKPGSWAAELLPEGHWGYVNNVVVSAEARGIGAGQALMSVAHDEFHRAGARGTYLYYNPPNPLSPVFWHRQGYRPLWTMWEVQPASALR